MADTALKEFDQFRFVREDNGSLATLPSTNSDEQMLMVLDCERYRLARLHIFQGGAKDSDRSEWFKREMAAISKMYHPCLSGLISWGSDENELFYADQMVKGEAVGSYLKRNGAVPMATTARLTLDLISVLTCQRALPRTLENFSPVNLHLTSEAENGGIRLKVSDFSNWDKPCVLMESELTARVAGFAKILLTGNSDGTAALPDGVATQMRDLIEKNSNSQTASSLNDFATELTPFAADISGDKLVRPQSFLRHWLLRGSDTLELGSEFKEAVPATRDRYAPELAYAFDARLQGPVAFAPTRFQIFPGHESIPRSGWFEQHQAAMRRPGRGFPNQLAVQSLEPRGRTLLIGEERIEGLNLQSIVRQLGPLPSGDAIEMGTKVSAALDAIERSTSSCPIWWLPPENIYAVTGSEDSASLKEALDRFGSTAWQRLPMRLRLHQTAASLLEGVQLPTSLLKLIETRGKSNDNARRSAVLAPVLWFALTGERFSWRNPIQPIEGRIAPEVAAVFEKARTSLREAPENVHSNFIDELSGGLAKIKAGPRVGQGSPVQAGEGVSAVMGPVIGAAAADSGQSQQQTFIEPSPDAASEGSDSALGAEPESLGEIVDDSMWGEEGAPPETDAVPEKLDAIVDDSLIAPVVATAAAAAGGSWFKRKFSGKGKPEAAEKKRESDVGEKVVENNTQAEESVAEKEEPEPEIEPGPAKESSLSPLPFEAAQVAAPETSLVPEPESVLEPNAEPEPIVEPETIAALEPEPVSEPEPIADLEPEPVVEPITEPETEAIEEPKPEPASNLFTNPSRETAPRSYEPESIAGFGERIIAQSGSDSVDGAKRKKSGPWGRITFFALIAAAVVGGGAHLYGKLSNWFERQDLAEQFPKTDYQPKFLKTDPLGDSGSASAKEAEAPEVDVTEGIEKMSVAIQKGDVAREAGSYADAVNLYLHALKLEPGSSEARTQLWKTLEIWNEKDAPVGRINAGKLEQAAQYAPQAAWLLSEYYLRRDPALGLHWLKKSADAGHPADMRKLGVILTQGKLATADSATGMTWIRKAADKGDPQSQFFYGECLVLGQFLKKDPHQGTDYLEKAAEAGNADAKELLGVCMIEGIGTNENKKAGFQHLVESAELGNATANLQIGLCLSHGDGTPRDESAAAAAFKKGAELGHPSAMYSFAKCLEIGFGGRESATEASDWMKKAAGRGHDEGQAWCNANGVSYTVNR